MRFQSAFATHRQKSEDVLRGKPLAGDLLVRQFGTQAGGNGTLRIRHYILLDTELLA